MMNKKPSIWEYEIFPRSETEKVIDFAVTRILFPVMGLMFFVGLFIIIYLSAKSDGNPIPEAHRDDVAHCTDTRDGETWTWRLGDTYDLRGAFFQDQCLYYRDTEGKDRVFCESYQQFIKCDKVGE